MVRPSGVVELWPSSSCCNKPPTRTSKNSSRLLAEMARNFTRSSSGLRRSPASSSTRQLNFSHDASRFRSVARLLRVCRTIFVDYFVVDGGVYGDYTTRLRVLCRDNHQFLYPGNLPWGAGKASAQPGPGEASGPNSIPSWLQATRFEL